MKNQEVKNSNESSLSQKALDVISRQAALDCFHDWIDRHGDAHTPDEMAEYRAIEELPSAQPEIIHCRDCINIDPVSVRSGSLYCTKIKRYMTENDFCSLAERITDERPD